MGIYPATAEDNQGTLTTNRREQRRWESRISVSVTYCRFCQKGMSVVGIAFFAPSQRDHAAA